MTARLEIDAPNRAVDASQLTQSWRSGLTHATPLPTTDTPGTYIRSMEI